MNGKINLDLKYIKFIFAKNKAYLIPIVVMLISIALFFLFVIPQFKLLLKVQNDAKESLLKLETLKKNLNVLTGIDEDTLDSQLRILNSALPLSKDFAGILNSIYVAAQKTGVSVGNFSFKIGNLSQSESNEKFPLIKLSVPVNAGVGAVNSFVGIISKTLPLSQISFIRMGDASSTVDLSFYYKPLGASSYSQDVVIRGISQEGLNLLNKLNEFESPSSVLQLAAPTSTASAI
jgi:hypothetical protein